MKDSNQIRVLCADDHPIVREGMVGLIDSETDMIVVGEASNGDEAIALFRQHRPDVVLMDIQMPGMDGVTAIGKILEVAPAAKLVVLTTYDGDVPAARALRAGARGYLLKTMLRKQLLDTIRLVHAGRRVIPPEICEILAIHFNDDQLTPRELQVLRLVASGQSNKLIAASLGISDDTVKNHVANVMEKLSANDRTHAVTIATRRGFLVG